MKNSILVLFVLFLGRISAQQEFPKLLTIITEDRIFEGTINNKYPITMYLKIVDYSQHSGYVYSVKGWYYYNNIRKKIPIVGIFDNNLILYSFNSKKLEEDVLNIMNKDSYYLKDRKLFLNITNYEEKFIIDASNSSWSNKRKSLSFKLDQTDLAIRKTSEYLLLKRDLTFTIPNFEYGYQLRNFKIIAKTSNKIILRYDHLSSLFYNGMCGAGFEHGFLYFQFDSNYNLTRFDNVLINSCMHHISLVDKIKITKSKTKYRISGSKEASELIIDKKNVTFTKN